jgi:hypothetical protein
LDEGVELEADSLQAGGVNLGGVVVDEKGEDQAVSAADAVEVGAFADPADLPGDEVLFLHEVEQFGEAAPAEVEGFGGMIRGIGATHEGELVPDDAASEEAIDIDMTGHPIAQVHIEWG